MPGSSTELSDQSNTELEKTHFGSNYYYQSTATYENYPSFLINFFKVKYTELEVWWLFYKLLSVFSYQQFAINIIFWSNLIILSLWLKKNKTFGKEIKCAQYQHWVISADRILQSWSQFPFIFLLKENSRVSGMVSLYKKENKIFFPFPPARMFHSTQNTTSLIHIDPSTLIFCHRMTDWYQILKRNYQENL